MSFSFAASGKTKDEVIKSVSEQMDGIIKGQENHARDKDAVVSCVGTYVDLLEIADGETISVSVSGSLSWTNKADKDSKDVRYTGAGISISARVYQTP